MTLARKTEESLLERGYSRRQIARIAMGAAAAIPFFTEFAQAQQADQQMARRTRQPFDPEVVRISSNENPMGPTPEGIDAMAKVGPLGWRYSPQGQNLEFDGLLHSIENVKPGYVNGYPGSSMPLAQCAPAFTSPTRSWVMGSPGYGSGAGRFVGNKVHKVPLRKDYTHDVEAMIKADPNAGAFYICNPNNPTGTLTPRKRLRLHTGQQAKGRRPDHRRGVRPILPARRITRRNWFARTRMWSCFGRSRRSMACGSARRRALRTPGSALPR